MDDKAWDWFESRRRKLPTSSMHRCALRQCVKIPRRSPWYQSTFINFPDSLGSIDTCKYLLSMEFSFTWAPEIRPSRGHPAALFRCNRISALHSLRRDTKSPRITSRTAGRTARLGGMSLEGDSHLFSTNASSWIELSTFINCIVYSTSIQGVVLNTFQAKMLACCEGCFE